jgi:glycosyltransferase involved in cell wall biosynthesis
MELISQLPDLLPDVDFHVVGGRDAEVSAWRNTTTCPNLHFHGFVPHAELSAYYARFDVVLLPQQEQVAGENPDSQIGRWTSPLKAFEYMAHHKPIVASDLPVLREVFSDGCNALLVSATQAGAWCEAIQKLCANRDLALRIADSALVQMMKKHTWAARAQSIVETLK